MNQKENYHLKERFPNQYKNIMKRIITTLLLFFVLLEGTIQAIPAKRTTQTITQPDGTTLTTLLQGDENFHYLTTTDGIMLQEAADGFMKYATVNTSGVLTASEYTAHDPGKRGEPEKAFIKGINTAQINNAVQKIRVQESNPRWLADTDKPKFPNQGTVRGLIILAQFKDVKFAAENTPEEFRKMMNSEGYSANGATGSARDYFIDQSSGVFTPEFDIVGPVTLPENMSFYGGNNIYGKDQNPAQMTVDACYAADTLLNVDFSQYDSDNDGKVDLVFIIYAGYAEAQGGPAASVWPHAWNLEYAGFKDIKMDGKQIYSYACSSERHGKAGTTMDGIGTFCHEFSHCLGLPDIYDTRYTGMVGMGSWSLMDYGAYNNENRTPAGYSAYERYSVGWLNPVVLKDPQKDIELKAMDTANQAYLLVSDQNPNEYYTIENRQQNKWDAYLPGHGMMIVHVDYVPSLWESNVINSSVAGHPHLQIVPADNEFDDYAGDLFPGTTQNTSFTDESEPASTLYSGGFLSKPLSNIREKDGTITFDFMHFVGTPVATEATDITEDSFTANWEPVNNATSYTLEVSSCMTGRKNISEEFGKFTKGSPEEADEQDISNALSTYTETDGWTGSEIYQAGGHARMGNKNTGGSLTTPLLDLTREKEFTLCCSVKGSKSLISGFIFQLLDANGKILLDKTMMMNASEKTLYWVVNTDAPAGYIRIATKAAATFDYIHIYDGDVKEQLEKNETMTTPEEYKNSKADITDNSFNFTGLISDKKYIYNVYAKMNEEVSQKSNKVVVQTLKYSGIETSSASRGIYTQKGSLRFTSDIQETIHIYTANGMNIHTGISREGTNEIALPNGFYIVIIGKDKYKIHIP